MGAGDDKKDNNQNPAKIEEQKEETKKEETKKEDQNKAETEAEETKEDEKEERPVKADDSEYIFPESDTRLLTREEVEAHSKEELRLARNEIFARHGMIFGGDLEEYFSSKSWYTPTVPGEEFYDRVEMSLTEEANIELIQEVEATK